MQPDTPTIDEAPTGAAEDAAPAPDGDGLPEAAESDALAAEVGLASEHARPDVQGKPFGIRAWAYIVDIVVLNVVGFAGGVAGFVAFSYLLAALGQPLAPSTAQPEISLIALVQSVIVTMLYFALFEWLFGATPGKALLKMRVVREDGTRVGLWAVIVRDLFRLFDGLVFGLPAYLAMERQKHSAHQRIGDRYAHTVVVGHHDPIIRDQRSWAWFAVAALLAVPLLSISTMAATLSSFRVSQPPVAAPAADINLDESDFDGSFVATLSQGKETYPGETFQDASVRVFVNERATVESRVMVLSFMPTDTIQQAMTPLMKSLATEGLGPELTFSPIEAVAVGDRAGIVRFRGLTSGREGYALMFIRRNVMGRLIVLSDPGTMSQDDVVRLARAMDGAIR